MGVLLHPDPTEPKVLRWSLYLYHFPSALIFFSFDFPFLSLMCVLLLLGSTSFLQESKTAPALLAMRDLN